MLCIKALALGNDGAYLVVNDAWKMHGRDVVADEFADKPKRTGVEQALIPYAAIHTCGAGVPDGRANTGHQLGSTEGFGDVIVGSRVKDFYFICLVNTGRNHNDRKPGPAAHRLNDLHTVHIR